MNFGSGNFRRSDSGQRVQLAQASQPSTTNMALDQPIVRLWETVLKGIYKDIVISGETSEAYRDAVQGEDELEMVASSLGCRQGFITMLIDEAIKEHERRKNKRKEYDQGRDWRAAKQATQATANESSTKESE
jgi:hypothetical protein